jgi:hypothetical protein
MVIFRLILLLAIYFMAIPATQKGLSVEKSDAVKISKQINMVDSTSGTDETDEEEGELAVA